ncbi:flagellar motor protein MotB [Falsiroseomonas sp. HW251]|uniref:flagellar motor protein MotB n=1 Tax=Falsiroseomonas sp. HW251 TaxID=3390998 RepID=UPI003D316DA7
MARGKGATIVIRKVEEGGHGHHGGAWKVAYADFVTAMMAFFLLMWLLNATTEEQRQGIADYFSPTNVLGRNQSGNGEPFGGRTPNNSEPMTQDAGAITVQRGPMPVLPDVETEDESQTPARPVVFRDGPEGEEEDRDPRRVRTARADAPAGDQDPRQVRTPRPDAPVGDADPRAAPDVRQLSDAELRAEHSRREREAFERAAEDIRRAIAQDPALADLGRQLLIEQAPEGLRIQLLDADRQPMFALGGAAPNDRARALIARVAQVAARLPNPVAITGHTDATPFRGGAERSNWDLSAERANATRRLLTEAGVPEARIRSVSGMAERDPLLADQPGAAANRRVAITLIREAPDTPEPRGRDTAAVRPAAPVRASP